MKKSFFALLAAAMALMTVPAMAADRNDGADARALTSLWKQYESASKSDLPQKEASILAQIKKEATRRHLAADFYDAATLYVYTVQRRDWKQAESLRTQLEKEVKAFDEPIVTYAWMGEFRGASTEERWAFVRDHRDAFRGMHRHFHKNVYFMDGVLRDFMVSDYEYVLWDMVPERYYDAASPERDEIVKALMDEVRGHYPNEGFLEYYLASRMPGETGAPVLEELARRYDGRGLACYPRQLLLSREFRRLNREKAGEAAFRGLYARCQAFEKERSGLRGNEARIARSCTEVKAIMTALTSQSLQVRMDGREIQVLLRNMKEAAVTLRDENASKKIASWTAVDREARFYVVDTVRITLPDLPDGSYVAEAVQGRYASSAQYDQYTLSIAVRQDAVGTVYVADHASGRPLDRAKLVLKLGDEVKAVAEMPLDGFTPLPASMKKVLDDDRRSYYTLTAQTGAGETLRSSHPVSVRAFAPAAEDALKEEIYANIYRDRGAYNPGDTLRFKVVAYKGDLVEQVGVLTDEPLDVTLFNSESREIASLKLTTNRFGSASGTFALPKDQRNGRFFLRVRARTRTLATSYFRVDEFVLPTFTWSFDRDDRLYMPGDTVSVHGRLTAYSGHSTVGATVYAKVSRYGEVIDEQTFSPEQDGSFSVSFPAREAGAYRVEFTVTDATGETLGFSTAVFVNEHINIRLSVQNAADGEYRDWTEAGIYSWRYPRERKYILTEDVLRADFSVTDSDGKQVPVPVSFALVDGQGQERLAGEARTAGEVRLDLAALPSGLYSLRTKAVAEGPEGRKVTDEQTVRLLLLRASDDVLAAQVRRVHIAGPTDLAAGEAIRLRIAAADGPQWAVATLFGRAGQVLRTERIYLAGEVGEPGSLADLSWAYEASWPDAVRLQLFYFKHGEAVSFERQFRRVRTRMELPLTFTSFTDRTLPGTEYRFTLKTAPEAEALAAVYDRSIDAIQPLSWPVVHLRDFSIPSVRILSEAGGVTGEDFFGLPEDGDEEEVLMEDSIALGGGPRMMKMAARNAPVELVAYSTAAVDDMVMEMEESAEMAEAAPQAAADAGDVAVRSKFEAALTFQPHLTPDPDGNLSFSFRTSDKLSTYYVAVYAHDPAMRNALVRQEMVVSVPVKVSVVEPQFLYRGDAYELAASVSSAAADTVSGFLYLYTYPSASYETDEPLSVQRIAMRVPAGGVEAARFPVRVPAVDTLGFKVVFEADGFSDGVFLPVPVKLDAQTVTEAHSAVLRAGMDRDVLLRELRGRFVNVPGAEATLREISILEMVRAAIPAKAEPAAKDVLSLSEAYYVRRMAARLGMPSDPGADAELLTRILACRAADGGFAWFEGMNASAVITAVLLERFAKLRDHGIDVPDLSATVRFLDRNQFTSELPTWRGWISDAQYMYVRALYPTVPFEVKPVTAVGKKRWTEFKKYAKSYLTPSAKDGRGLQGQILAKARRLRTLSQLAASTDGTALAKAWGVGLGASAKIGRSLRADAASLLEYAVEHRDGGWYYPNAVMPWRGLLESEAYAHAMLCDLLTAVIDDRTVPDGIRLWLMLQKETQHWDEDPAFVDALTSILDGSQEVLDTRVLALSATFSKPFAGIEAAGNGFTIRRRFFREETVERVYDDRTREVNDRITELREIMPGTPVSVGDRILARYEVWSQENRSFVRLDAFREAALRPADQLSGHSRIVLGSQGYRNVKADRTEYFFDVFPEERTEITEVFYVTQAGTFTAPVVTIESLYAPHYRANDAFRGTLSVR